VQQQVKSAKQNQLPRSNNIIAVPRLNNKPGSPKQTVNQETAFWSCDTPNNNQSNPYRVFKLRHIQNQKWERERERVEDQFFILVEIESVEFKGVDFLFWILDEFLTLDLRPTTKKEKVLLKLIDERVILILGVFFVLLLLLLFRRSREQKREELRKRRRKVKRRNEFWYVYCLINEKGVWFWDFFLCVNLSFDFFSRFVWSSLKNVWRCSWRWVWKKMKKGIKN